MIRLSSIVVLLAFACLSFADVQFERKIVDDKNPKDPWVKIAGDINGDGYADIVIGGRSGPVVWYAYPDWKKAQVGQGGYNTVDGEIGDVDGDGDADVVVGAEFWYENLDGKGASWKDHRISEIRSHDIELADLDGDGDLDLIARDQSGFGHNTGNKIQFWRQDKPGSWTYRAIDCPHGEGLTVYDLDRDGDLDVIAGRRWYENSGDIVDGKWTAYDIAPDWHQDTVVKAGDINGDGFADVVLTRSEGPYRISWFQAPADPKQSPWKERAIDASFDFGHALDLADMDGDGDLDVVTAEMHQSERDRVIVYLNEGGGERWKATVISTKGSHAMRAIDIGGDGVLDVMGANWSGDYQPVELWINKTPQQTQRIATSCGLLEIYPIRHASFVMKWDGKTIYVDPVGGADLYKNFPKADLILITHDHGDHLNEDTMNGVSIDRTKIIAPAVVSEKLTGNNKSRTTVQNNGDRTSVLGVDIESIPMYNLTPDRQQYHQKGKGNGYVLTVGGKRVYIAGDTEDIPEMKALKDIDVAFVCMNLPYTMTVERAASVVREFKPKIVYPYHSRGSDLNQFKKLVGTDVNVDVRILDWYK